MEGKIICSFFGTGKTYLNKNYPNFIDLEAHYFGNRTDLFIKAIIDAAQVYKYNVLVACTKPIIEMLQENNLEFVVILPTKNQKKEYMARYQQRGSKPQVIKGLDETFETVIDEVMSCDCKKIILKSNQYLKDVLEEIG